MERKNKATFVIANTYSAGDTVIVGNYRINCIPCSISAMQYFNGGSFWRYAEQYSKQPQHNLASITEH